MTDRSDITSVVYSGCKATNQTNKNKQQYVYAMADILQETIEDIDKDKDGFISLEEYIGKFCCPISHEPCYEKTGLWGFRPGPPQTGLYSHRRWLEA